MKKSADFSSILPPGRLWFYRWLAKDFRTRDRLAFSLFFLLPWLPVAASMLEGTFWQSPGLNVPLSKDLGYFNLFCLVTPGTAMLYRFYFRRINEAVEALFESRVFVRSELPPETLTRAATGVRHWAFDVLPWLLAVAFSLLGFRFFVIAGKGSWHTHPDGLLSWAAILHLPLLLLVTLLLASFGIHLAGVFVLLRQFFKSKPNVAPLHADGCGGLLPLGAGNAGLHLCAFLFSGVTIIGLESNRIIYGYSYGSIPSISLICAYIVGASLAFFAPLYPTHAAMKAAKRNLLLRLSRESQHLHRELLTLIRAGGSERLVAVNSKLEILNKLHEAAIQMPVWPFNFRNMRTFIAAVGLPPVWTILEQTINRFS